MLLAILVFIIIFSRKVFTQGEGEIVHQMPSNQRKGFGISFSGVLFLSFAMLTSIALSTILIIESIKQGETVIGYLVLFYVIPFGLLLSVGISVMMKLLRTIKPSHFSQQALEVSKYQMLVGAIGLIAFPFYYRFVTLAIYLTLSKYDWLTEFAYNIDEPGFHLGKLIIIPFIAGPILLFIGGLIGYFANKNETSEKGNFEELE